MSFGTGDRRWGNVTQHTTKLGIMLKVGRRDQLCWRDGGENKKRGVTFAAKGYFEALVRMGEMASKSQGSKDLGES
ncbi:unnamed protein product [Coregonus sp. 'balchen']|nr:unnamed protein product [Coregonus sp. 'balchen']